MVSISECNDVVPKNIAKIIEDKGLKQSAVAKWAGYTNQQLTNMLNGRKLIKLCDVTIIANALGVSVNDLFADAR